jgi:hypothetical protein
MLAVVVAVDTLMMVGLEAQVVEALEALLALTPVQQELQIPEVVVVAVLLLVH